MNVLYIILKVLMAITIGSILGLFVALTITGEINDAFEWLIKKIKRRWYEKGSTYET